MGLNGGAGGTGFAGPAQAPVRSPVTDQQATDSYTQNQNALQQQQALVQALQGQNGLQNQSNVYGQLQGVANGTGPNPAQAMLANATGANTANQAALMAGQRGTGANAGLIARQAGMQGAANQQNAAGQGAAMQAQQSLGALGQMGALANQQAGQQIGATQNLTAANQQEQQNLLNSIAGVNQANVGMQSNINNANAGMTEGVQGAQAAGIGGVAAGLGKGLATLFKAEGGEIQQPQGPQSHIGQMLSGSYKPMVANGGAVPAMVSPGEKYLPPKAVQQVKQGASPMAVGKEVPGKPKVSGAKDDYSNDTVKTTLQEGGIVLPRSVTKSKNPDKSSEEFVRHILAKHGMKK